MVLKLASTTPLSSLKLAAILDKAGLPQGVLNVVTGSGEAVGEAIVRPPPSARSPLPVIVRPAKKSAS